MKLLLIFTILLTQTVFAQQRLIMVGGGKRTPDVLTKIVEWSGGEKNKLLIITWASGEPEASLESIKKDFAAVSKIDLVPAPFSPLNEEKKAKLIQQLQSANGIFFTGGDQNRIMEVLKDAELFELFRQKYKEGVLMSGTSAGTAIMSEVMITGEGDIKVIDGEKIETKKGLGFLTSSIVDQHFIKRQRQNRLISLIFKHPNLLGIGIDENTALLVENNRKASVLGESKVMVFQKLKPKNEMKFTILEKGKTFDLNKLK